MDQHAQPSLPPDSPLMNMTNSFLNDGMLLLSMPGPSRDPTFYIHDGNSVLLVENTLFKVCICSFLLLLHHRRWLVRCTNGIDVS